MLSYQEISIVFKKAIKQRPFLFCCVLVSFFFAIIQISAVQAATPQTQIPLIAVASPTVTVTATVPAIATPTPTPTPAVLPGTVTVSPQTVEAGKQITVTGENWPFQQQVTVQVASNGQSDVMVYSTALTDPTGHFSTTLTIPANTAAGTYSLVVFVNNQSSVARNSTITVSAITPTPTPSPTVSPSPTATATAVSSGSNGGGGGSAGLTVLIFTLGGLGTLLIIIGAIMFAASSPQPANPNMRMR